MSATLLRRASVALVALTVACGDSTGPNLSEEQVYDMLDAMSVVASYDQIPGTPAAGAALRAAPTFANATVSVNSTVSCPNGGSASLVGTATDNEQTPTNTVSATVTHSFSGCSAPSSEGRMWTFNGAPNIVTTLNATVNETAGTMNMTVTQAGGVRFASDLGEGTCEINLTLTMSGTPNSFSASISGSACGRSIQQTVQVTD